MNARILHCVGSIIGDLQKTVANKYVISNLCNAGLEKHIHIMIFALCVTDSAPSIFALTSKPLSQFGFGTLMVEHTYLNHK